MIVKNRCDLTFIIGKENINGLDLLNLPRDNTKSKNNKYLGQCEEYS